MTKQKLSEIAKTILNKYELKQTLSEEDRTFMFEQILKNHPEFDWYESQGYLFDIKVDSNIHGTRSFWISDDNGKFVSFSYIKCVKNV